MDAESVLINRSTKWGNPYGMAFGRKNAIQLFNIYLHESGLINSLRELYGKKLFCHCHPLPCHGDVLLQNLYQIQIHELE